FITQCVARVHQRLAVTEIEVARVASAFVNIFIWLLWWNKPLDVQWPIVIGPFRLTKEESPPPLQQISRFEQLVIAIFGFTSSSTETTE
ncbi:hypothetical protein K438DRAFT_1558624, partial [Mycena galopus ATCC 62051]